VRTVAPEWGLGSTADPPYNVDSYSLAKANMTDDKKPELKVRDALRKGVVPIRDVPFMRATSLLFDRIFRRPAGNSARIWKRMEWEDPFEDKPYRSRKMAYKGVYAKGRFVRIDKAQAKAQPKPKKDPHADLVERLKKAKAREAEEARAKKAAEAKAKKSSVADAAKAKVEPIAPVIPLPTPKTPEPEPIDRRPPMPTLTPKSRRSGRMSTRNQSMRPGRRRPVLSTVPPNGLTLEERRPPMPQPANLKPTPIDTNPAPVDTNPAAQAEAPQKTSMVPLPVPESPKTTSPKKEAPSTPVNRSPSGNAGGGAGMDDLFNMGGGQGRLRIRKSKEEEAPEKDAPEDDSSR